MRLEKDLEALQYLKISSTIDSAELIELQEDGLCKLQAEAAKLLNVLADSDKPSSSTRLKYAFKYKSDVARFHDETQQWYSKYAISFYLLARVLEVHGSGGAYHGQIAKTIGQLRNARLEQTSSKTVQSYVSSELHRVCAIRFSTAVVSRNFADRTVVSEFVPSVFPERDRLLWRDMQDLASILANFDPFTTCLLTCDGAVKSTTSDGHGFELIFSIPPGLHRPRTLRDLLQDDSMKQPSLNQRLSFAKSLITSVLCIHAAAFVHKNIRPETILVFDSDQALCQLFLIGFQYFRATTSSTFGDGDESWTKAIYRHPKRQGLHPESNYKMQHDIYSLGICLLELGIWESFVRYTFEPKDRAFPRYNEKLITILAYSNIIQRRHGVP